MVGTSKVLTVSYGTFSCTLEGFDDSFSTMKAIAEYFRDLAADDRYFGAEPPTPDAEMLARIAQREISRNVEAKIGDNGVVLRASQEAPGLAPAVAPQVAEEPAPAPVAAATPEPEVQPEAPAEVAKAPEAPAEADNEFETVEEGDDLSSVAAKLRRIRSVVQHAETGGVTSIYAGDDDAAAFFEGAEGETADQPAAKEEAEEEVAEAQPEAEVVDEVVAEVEADDQEDQIEVEAEAEVEAEEEAPAETAETPEAEEADDDDSDTAVSDVMARLAAASAVAADEDEFEEDLQPADVTEDSDFASEIMAEEAFEADEAEEVAEPEVAEAEEDTAENDEDEGAEIDDAAILAAASQAMSQDADDEEIEEELSDETAEDNAEDDAEDDAEDEAELAEAEAEDDTAGDVHIVKVKRDVLEEAVAADSMDEILAPHILAAKAQEAAEDSSLSPEEEADLMAELAEVEADDEEIEEEDTAQDDDAQGDDEQPQEAAEAKDDQDEEAPKRDEVGQAVAHSIRRDRRAVLVEGNDDASLSRILEHTNTELQSGEGTRRRAAIAHLKAAVAATVADRKGGKAKTDDADKEAAAYRDDLAQVVRPRRLSAKGNEERPRQAPLMLVSELRIDRPSGEQIAPAQNVRPRRVSKGNLAIQLDDADADEDLEAGNVFSDRAFARFAAEKGATELPDLLEAAAAYACHIEGRPHFSRPQIMKEVARAQPENAFSREEGLRAFGTLLRQGKIRKLKRGQFVVSDDTRFNPKAG